ncbi:MAG TPA: AmmeMemoRadiSam system protein B [Spirochaetota bacterium]|jgi:AmmeMemoRadiSam system protein B|nr:AmmeMemoRadiSam system protein B [Spirochaetota bacterium]HPV42306.1 AmmeMemoRadiSam system protein B [Spirochaetota bacterium]
MYRRKPAVAGSFYPSNSQRLGVMIDSYLTEAQGPSPEGEVIGVISPHAGYVYSGPVAAYSFHRLAPDTELVIVLAPSHRARFNGAAILPEGVFETPLGDVPIDAEIGSRLKDRDYFGVIKEAHELEHSLEVQVPFLQKVLKGFSLVPIIVGTVDLAICRAIAEGIHAALAGETRRLAVVISTDLSHYHSYNTAQTLDRQFSEALKTFDERKVQDIISAGKAEACGEGPVLTGMVLCRLLGAAKVDILKYANSGDTAGTKDQVVGYLAAAFVK